MKGLGIPSFFIHVCPHTACIDNSWALYRGAPRAARRKRTIAALALLISWMLPNRIRSSRLTISQQAEFGGLQLDWSFNQILRAIVFQRKRPTDAARPLPLRGGRQTPPLGSGGERRPPRRPVRRVESKGRWLGTTLAGVLTQTVTRIEY